MANLIDLTNKTFEYLKVIRKSEVPRGRVYWDCKCVCGNTKSIRGSHLRGGFIKSCGCKRGRLEIGILNKKHGLSKTKLYKVRQSMIERCYNKNNPSFKYWGGKGIKVCDEWLNKENGFMNFYKWAMQNGYKELKGKDKLSIDRINPNEDYKPTNCYWATYKEQNKHLSKQTRS